jgi:hypothetical protein
MTRSKVTSFCTFLTLAALLIVVAPLRASDPVGAYAIVDKIVLEPATGPAMAVQIHGVFSLAHSGATLISHNRSRPAATAREYR